MHNYNNYNNIMCDFFQAYNIISIAIQSNLRYRTLPIKDTIQKKKNSSIRWQNFLLQTIFLNLWKKETSLSNIKVKMWWSQRCSLLDRNHTKSYLVGVIIVARKRVNKTVPDKFTGIVVCRENNLYKPSTSYKFTSIGY